MNYQNIPRDDKVVKRAIMPRRGAFSFFDYSQIEPRLFAYLSAKVLKDESIAEWFRQGRDYYSELASQVFHRPAAEITPDERQMAKVWFLMSLYGAGPKKISVEVGLSMSEAEKFYTRFHAGLPQIKLISNPKPRSQHVQWEPGAIERMYRQRGFLKTPWGRHLHAEPFGEFKLLNKWIQGTAAEIMRAGLTRIDTWQQENDVDSRLVSTVHDEYIMDGPESELALLHEAIPALMIEATRAPAGDFIHEWVPFASDHEVSTTSWADKIDYDDYLGGLSGNS